jgi:hypothetical protein
MRGSCRDLRLVRQFADMLCGRRGHNLPAWTARAEASPVREVRGFAAGLRKDWAAVTAGLTLPYSSGPAEGHVNRIEMIKRQMYGRATRPAVQAGRDGHRGHEPDHHCIAHSAVIISTPSILAIVVSSAPIAEPRRLCIRPVAASRAVTAGLTWAPDKSPSHRSPRPARRRMRR